MKKLIGVVFTVVVLSLSVNSFSECLPRAGKADPAPVLKWGMSKCLGKITGEMKVGEDRTVTLKLVANQAYWFSASGCARVELIFIGVFGPEGVMLKTNTSSRPAFCFKTEEAGNYTFLLMLQKAEPKVKKSNVNSCITMSECKAECED